MFTSYQSSLKDLHAELLRNAEAISRFLVVINIRFRYQDTFPFAEDNKGNTFRASLYLLSLSREAVFFRSHKHGILWTLRITELSQS
jgi:hypothetical protein